MGRVLDGLKVIDFGQYIAAPLVGAILSDNGAEVVRIDPPGGPRWKNSANAILQRGKRSMVLDLKDPADNAVARDLIAGADIVLEGFRPGVMARLGVGPDAMTSANPRLIYCSIPGFGSDDPRSAMAGWEGIVGAAAALHAGAGNAIIASSGIGGSAPSFNPIPFASSYAAAIAARSILAALIARTRFGRGQIVEVAMFDAVFEGVGVLSQQLPAGTPNAAVHQAIDGVYQCADGKYIYICMPTPEFWERFSTAFMGADWFDSGLADFQALVADPAKAQEAKQHIASLFQTRTASDWDELANQALMNFTVCKTTKQWLGDEQAIACGAAIGLDDPELGATRQAGYAFHLDVTPPCVSGPRHVLNADSDAIRNEITAGRWRADYIRGAVHDIPAGGPLDGINVVDASHYLAGPTCGRIMAELGANVIKVDAPARSIAGYLHVNSGKRSALIDLKQEPGLSVMHNLLGDADIFIESFSPGTTTRLGVDEESVRKIQPGIVYTSVNCYGHQGPRANFHGVEAVGQAATGMAWRWGGDVPRMQRLLSSDYGAGHLSALATLMGLYHRLTAGEGQHAYCSLVQAATFHQMIFAVDYEGKVWDEPHGPEALGWSARDRLYASSDGWFYLVVANDADRSALNEIEGLADIAGLEAGALAEKLTACFATQDTQTWTTRLNAARVPAYAVADFQELLNSEIVRDRGLVISRVHPGIGDVRAIGIAPYMSLTPVHSTEPIAYPPGSATAQIVGQAGLGERWDDLMHCGAVADKPAVGTFLWL